MKQWEALALQSSDVLIKQLAEAAGELGLVVGRSESKSKYEAALIVALGIPMIAAGGIATFVNYNYKRIRRRKARVRKQSKARS